MSTWYRHVDTGEKVSIINDNGNFYTLNNGAKIVKSLFVQKYVMQTQNTIENVDAEQFLNQQTQIKIESPKTVNQNYATQNESVIIGSGPVVDPIDFLHSHNTPIQGLETLQNINTNKMIDDNVTGTQVRIIQPDDNLVKSVTTDEEKKRLLDEYNKKLQQNNLAGKFINEDDDKAIEQFLNQNKPTKPKKKLNENGLTVEQELWRQDQIKLTGVDPYAEKIARYRNQQEYSINLESEPIPSNIEYSQLTKIEDPSQKIFKTFKRTHPIIIKLNIEEKISKPEFIALMSEGLEGDIIKYFADDIVKSFLSDITKIKNEIYNQIYKEVYGKLPQKEIGEKPPIEKPPKPTIEKPPEKQKSIKTRKKKTTEKSEK